MAESTNNSTIVQLRYSGADVSSSFNASVQTASFSSTLDAWKTASIEFIDNAGKLEAFLQDLQATFPLVVEMRYGSRAGGNDVLTPWERWVILDYRTAQDVVVVDLADVLYLFTAKKRTSARRGTIANAIATCVTDIETEYKLELSAAIEPTQKVQQLYYQSNADNWEFITSRLLPRAANADGSAGYHIWDRQGIICCATLDYSYAFHTIANVRVANALKANTINQQLTHGAAGVVGCAYDTSQGALTQCDSSATLTLRHADITPKLDTNFNSVLYRHLSHNGDEEIQAQVQSQFCTAYASLYTARFLNVDSINVCTGDVVDATINGSGEPNPTWNGLWTVTGVKHVVEHGSLSTAIKVSRGEQTRVYGTTPKTAQGHSFRKSVL